MTCTASIKPTLRDCTSLSLTLRLTIHPHYQTPLHVQDLASPISMKSGIRFVPSPPRHTYSFSLTSRTGLKVHPNSQEGCPSGVEVPIVNDSAGQDSRAPNRWNPVSKQFLQASFSRDGAESRGRYIASMWVLQGQGRTRTEVCLTHQRNLEEERRMGGDSKLSVMSAR
jgi:hypothetical protein